MGVGEIRGQTPNSQAEIHGATNFRLGIRSLSPDLGLCFLLACAAIAWAAPLPQSENESLPGGPGKDTFISVCSLCHAPTTPLGKQWTREQWQLKVTEMLQEEPDVTAEERAAILEYLASNFRPGGKIYINKAAANDLETALEISSNEAEAIVRYRKAQGDFKTLDDLKKVPGVDSAKIDLKKDRLVF